MPSELCPLCRTAANMMITVTARAIAGRDSKMKTITTRTYHCESCGSFVRSIDEDEGAPAAAAEKGVLV
jgi:hypothetical protein